jgi:hypothetical protein
LLVDLPFFLIGREIFSRALCCGLPMVFVFNYFTGNYRSLFLRGLNETRSLSLIALRKVNSGNGRLRRQARPKRGPPEVSWQTAAESMSTVPVLPAGKTAIRKIWLRPFFCPPLIGGRAYYKKGRAI